ncbi:ATP-dependent nuclease [Bacillus sp. PS06]|uniref:ATP-dependent nuclease n=1 Tax=Bacillus sp. PS06 TaxID=2764176 RepID=UPI00177D91E4|nr:AAA family ATPase [Bacillus sp. PS06]MBD8070018.1 AAA family ATPase [Bacillus sp. PS06]
MRFNSIYIKGFRNFEEISLDLTNRNVIFGLNDIGKTNFLGALRFLLDRDFRKYGFVDTDFFNKKIDGEINIILEVNIEDESSEDNKKIYTAMKGAIPSDAKVVFFQLKAKYNPETLRGEPELFWGSDKNNLDAIPSNQSFYEVDRLFNVVYIDSSIKMDNEFRRYTREILRADTSLDETERKKVNLHIGNLNKSIGRLKSIKKFESDLVKEYKRFRDEKNLKISIQSEIELSNIHSKLTPYILNEDSETYPTGGDGRKKILAYTLLALENRRNEDKKINIFLIEELENHLHRSMQIALSYQLFSDGIFKYLFITTHSSLIVSQMDDVNLIKLFKDKKVNAKSYTYVVPDNYKKVKHKLNENLSEAIFADVVLLVEGPSEKVLFERILREKHERYESFGGYILQVDGIDFSEYYRVLSSLGIKVIVKTDNDLKLNKKKSECNLLGLNRGLSIVGSPNKPNKLGIDVYKYENDPEYKKALQKSLYDKDYSVEFKELRNKGVYISRIDLENDLYEIIPNQMDLLAKNNHSRKNGVDFLQTAKMINMIELCKTLNSRHCKSIVNHEYFGCIKELIESCAQ